MLLFTSDTQNDVSLPFCFAVFFNLLLLPHPLLDAWEVMSNINVPSSTCFAVPSMWAACLYLMSTTV